MIDNPQTFKVVASQVGGLTLLAISIGLLYASVPINLHYIRAIFAFMQLIVMAITMFIAINWAIEDF
jgi:uncharacterized membrane protein